MPLPPVVTAPVVVSAPELPTVTLPPPVWPIAVTVSVAAVFVSATLPLVVFVALKLTTVFALLSVWPPFEFVVNSAAVSTLPVPASVIVPVAAVCAEFSVTLPLVVMSPPVLIAMF